MTPFRYAHRVAALKPSAIREILKVTETPDVISFAGGLPAPELFPIEDIGRAAERVLTEDGPGALQYGITEGHLPLREWVCAHLRETVGLNATPDQILITAGSQQGLDLIGKVLLDPGDVVVVENPAYLGALQAFQAQEARIVGLPADAEGLSLEALRDFLASSASRPKFIYLVTNFQNPTGASTSAARRRALVALAAEAGIPLIEDDPYGRLRYSGDDVPALAALSGARDCVYLGTASKIIAPGLRVAWMVVHERAFHERLVTAKQATDLHTSSFAQRIVWQYVRQPDVLASHLTRLRSAYKRRRDAMLAALKRHLPDGCAWTTPEGGLFLWVRLPEEIDALDLLRACGPHRVAFVPGAPFWIGRPVRATLRLNFSHPTEERIAEGIRRLGGVLAAELKKSRRAGRDQSEPGATKAGSITARNRAANGASGAS